MYRFAKVTLALVLALSLISFAAPQLTPTRADTGETYIVLYKQQVVPADAAGVIESRTFGGLRLAVDRLLARDLPGVLAAL